MDSQPLFPTPPPSGCNKGSHVQEALHILTDPDYSTVARHTTFLQQIINIETSCHLTQADSGLQKVVYDSLIQTLTLLQEYIGRPEYSLTLQKKCVQVIVCFLDKSTDNIRKSVIDKVHDLCSDIISKIESAEDNTSQVNKIITYYMKFYVRSSVQLLR